MDTTGFVLKYWFAMPQIQTKNYESISAFLGFCTFFLNLLKRLNPKLIVCTFDESLGTCFRNKIFPDYKKNREKAPQELKIQFKLCREFLNLIGINNMASEKYEADDIINTLSINNRKYGISNTILTNDKDLFQTIYDDDFWWDLNNKKYNHKDFFNAMKSYYKENSEKITNWIYFLVILLLYFLFTTLANMSIDSMGKFLLYYTISLCAVVFIFSDSFYSNRELIVWSFLSIFILDEKLSFFLDLFL